MRTETKFTPGPWEAVPEKLYNGRFHAAGRTPSVFCGDRKIADAHLPLGAFRKDGPSEEAEANARLIAAAPDLYNTLKAIFDCYEGGYSAESFAIHVEPFVQEAASVLAKARGESA